MIIGNSLCIDIVCREICILLLLILLILVRIVTNAERLKLGQQEQVVRGRCDRSLRVAGIARVVRVLRDRLHHCPQIARQRCHKTVRQRACRRVGVAEQRLPHIAPIPATGIGEGRIHVEVARARLLVAILTIAQADKLSVDLTDQKVDTVRSLNAAVVVEADDENINRHI